MAVDPDSTISIRNWYTSDSILCKGDIRIVAVKLPKNLQLHNLVSLKSAYFNFVIHLPSFTGE